MKNYTSQLHPGFSEFTATIKNSWGLPLENVYAKLFIDGIEVLHTPSININPWQNAEINGILKIDLEIGTYPAQLKVFFNNEIKEFPLTISITEENPADSNNYIYLTVILIALACVITIFFYWRRHHSHHEME